MRNARFLAVAVLALGLMACRESTAPMVDTVTVVKTDTVEVFPKFNGQAQIVIQAKRGVGSLPVVAVKADAFAKLSIEDFYLAESFVIDQKNIVDSLIVVGQFTESVIWAEDFPKGASWSLSGNMEPAASDLKVKFGDISSVYTSETWKTNGTSVFVTDKHKMETRGKDFQFTKQIDTKDVEIVWQSTIYFRAVTCMDYAARSIEPKNITQTVSDSSRRYTGRISTETMKITCNPIMPTSSATKSVAVPERIRLVDHIAGLRASMKR